MPAQYRYLGQTTANQLPSIPGVSHANCEQLTYIAAGIPVSYDNSPAAGLSSWHVLNRQGFLRILCSSPHDSLAHKCLRNRSRIRTTCRFPLLSHDRSLTDSTPLPPPAANAHAQGEPVLRPRDHHHHRSRICKRCPKQVGSNASLSETAPRRRCTPATGGWP